MRIRHNISSVTTLRHFSNNQTELGKNLEKLSSGYRINKAADDAAGLAVSESMRERIKGLDQGHNNIDDGIALIKTADGAMAEITEILQRISKLSIQARNGTYNEENLQEIQDEIAELKIEILRIADDTEFNDIQVLKQPYEGALQEYTKTIPDWLKNNSSASMAVGNISGYSQYLGPNGSFNYTPGLDDNLSAVIDFSGLVSKYSGSGSYTAKDLYNDVYDLLGTSIGMSCATCNKIYYGVAFYGTADELDTGETKEYFRESIRYPNGKPVTGNAIDLGEMTIDDNSSQTVFDYLSELVKNNADSSTLSNAAKTIANRLYSKTLDSLSRYVESTNHFNRVIDLNSDGSTLAFAIYDYRDRNSPDKEVPVNSSTVGYRLVSKGNIWIQCSSEKDDRILLDLPYLNLDVLGIKNYDVSKPDEQSDVQEIKNAISKISFYRARLGAQQNRLEHSRNNNEVMDENITGAESRIRDTDMAKEKSKYEKNTILIQSAHSVLGQIDKVTQGIMQMIEGM